MPDSTWSSISASQAPALFNQSPYTTRFTLWHAFKARDRSMIEAEDNTRMRAGRLLQQVILAETAERFRLEVIPNLEDTYERLGQLGCTIDGHMIAPDVGEIIIEAKNVDGLRFRDTWTETAAPPAIEIQLQQQMLVRQVPRGVIACFVGGNEMRFYEREANPEIQARLVEEAASFFASLEANQPPDPLGSALELPALAALYPTADPTEVLEDLDDEELSLAIREFAYYRDQESFAKKRVEAAKAKLLARAGTAGIVRARGVRCFIKKSPITEGVCAPHAEPKVTRKASIQTRITVEQIEDPAQAEQSGAWAA